LACFIFAILYIFRIFFSTKWLYLVSCGWKLGVFNAIRDCVYNGYSRKFLSILGPCTKEIWLHLERVSFSLVECWYFKYILVILSVGCWLLCSSIIGNFFWTIFFAVFWSYTVLVLFKFYFDSQPSYLFRKITGAAYATYIVHQWVIIPIAVGLAYTNLYPFLVIICAISPFLSWRFGLLLKLVPGSDIIL
jgi:hypothetical protein